MPTLLPSRTLVQPAAGVFLVFGLLLSACAAPASTTPPATLPTTTPAAATVPAGPLPTAEAEHGFFLAGRLYSDAPDDMATSFLDVVRYQATVDEAAESVEVVLTLRDIPETAARGQIVNMAEYWWNISIFLDPASPPGPDAIPDVGMLGMTATDDIDPNQVIQTPYPGSPTEVPIDQLVNNKMLFSTTGESLGTPEVRLDPERDTVTLRGHIPGIKATSLFTFDTLHFDGSADRPDSYVPPEAASQATPTAVPAPTAVSAADRAQLLIPAGPVHAFPGPEHYAGDVLTFEILLTQDFNEASDEVTLTLDDGPSATAHGKLLTEDRLWLPLAFDTAGLEGSHVLRFSTPQGSVNAAYAFEVLPAVQRPADELQAAWRVKDLSCCQLHYIAGTAAARDIDTLAVHFEKAASDLAARLGQPIDEPLTIYLVDRMWLNGAYSVMGDVVISYTDRQYGPMVGAQGLEIAARHEFSHVTSLRSIQVGDGTDFSQEGVAVYLAGGHYKPEPLAERGAALHDLGYYVANGTSIRQHELAYLYPAAMLTYIEQTYGRDKVFEFLTTDVDPRDGEVTPFDTAVQLALGVTLQQFDADFQAWLKALDPGPQLDDLRLTLALQDLRRLYQDTFTPPPDFMASLSVDEVVARPEYLPVLIREAHAPPNVATELLIAQAQEAIVAGEYDRAEQLVGVLDRVIHSGRFEDPLARDTLEIVRILAEAGYEATRLRLNGDRAAATAASQPTVLVELVLQRAGNSWQIVP